MKIALKKIKAVDIGIIQSELLKFLNHKTASISRRDFQEYCNSIIVIDTLEKMFFLFRAKIERQSKTSNILLSPTESVILLSCCQSDATARTKEQANVMQIISDLLHEKLVNI